MSRSAFEDMKKREIDHSQKTGRPMTEREADSRTRKLFNEIERDRAGLTKNYRGGERP